MVNECNQGQNSYNRINPKLHYNYSISLRSVNLGFVVLCHIQAGMCLAVDVISIVFECFRHVDCFDISRFHAFRFGLVPLDRVFLEQGAGIT